MNRRLAVSAVVACALAGCGSAGSTAPGPAKAPKVPAHPPATPHELTAFRTPSDDIGCTLGGGSARCDIRDRHWKPPPRPPSCALEWGQGLIVGASGRGRIVCAGDTTLDPGAPVLAYGRRTRSGAFTCTSQARGVMCVHTVTGHGFFLARGGYRLF